MYSDLANLFQLQVEPPAEINGELVVRLAPAEIYNAARQLKSEYGFQALLDLTAVDYLAKSGQIDAVYYFCDYSRPRRVRLRAFLPKDNCTIRSLTDLFDSARYLEREAHEMYGIDFDGNSDLRHLLLYEGFEGYPLRKEYPIDREQPIKEGISPIVSALAPDPRSQSMVLNFGPSHPATHGTIQIILRLTGETVAAADVHCGYLHRGFEKECERHQWQNIIPFTDRLNYCSPLLNNILYAETVEKLLGLKTTARCVFMRTLLSEYARLVDHLTCVGANIMELGAMTPFLYLMTIRDYMYEHLAHLTGARLTHSFVRFGGMAADFPPGWLDRLEELLKFYEDYVRRVHALLDRNRIFIDRMRDTGRLSPADAISYGVTGPILRSTGMAEDLRKTRPYLAYSALDFEIPVGIKGDNYDRYYVRMREMDESVHMIRQCVRLLPEGPVNSETTRLLSKPPAAPNVPPGEIYNAHEGANGELGFYIVSTGGRIPHRVHLRSPSFLHTGVLHKMLENGQLADVIASFGTINMIGGECDR